MTPAESFNYNIEAAHKYGNLCRVAIGFAIACNSDTEAFYAYLNARLAARVALAELSELHYAEGNAQNARERFQNAPTLKARRLAAEDLEFWTDKAAMLSVNGVR